jgi:hypothetical protein
VAFFIKRHDLLPNLPFQILDAAGAPRNCSDITSCYMVMRKQGTNTTILKKACTWTNQTSGIGLYDWVTGDTDIDGIMEYEFELTFTGGDIQTVPVSGYLTLTIVPDIG